MKIRNTLPQFGAVLFLIIALASCQEDFSTLGSDIIGGQIDNSVLNSTSTVIAYSKKLESVQTSELGINQLGVYNDPVYGKTKVELVSQLILGTTEPDFGEETVLDSVVLYIPLFSDSTVDGNNTTYTIDSVYGADPINIKVYESNYFLRDFDPASGLQERQKFYSTLGSVFDTPSNVGDLIFEFQDFVPDNEGYILLSPDGDDSGEAADITLAGPGLRAELPIAFFQDKIIDQEGSAQLMNNTNFKEYFRGLYFEVDDLGGNGNIFRFDLEEASVTLYYTYDNPDDSEDADDTIKGELALNFDNIINNVNLYENNLPANIESELLDVDTQNGEETLYLRGGQGIVSVIDLFGEDADGNGVADELDMMRSEQWLINEANLIFYVDQDKVTGGEVEPDRLLIYTAQNAAVLADYGFDITISNAPEDALTDHLGKLDRGSDESGDFYKMTITHHLSNLVHNDSTNVPLALMVTSNVLSGGFQELEDPITLSEDDDDTNDLNLIPSAGVISHEGTVLFGNNTSNEEKKLRLQIYYTKPN